MNELFVLIDKETGKFWKKPVGRSVYAKSKHPYAYPTLKRAKSVIGQFWPKPDPEAIKIVKFVQSEEAHDVQ